MLASFLGKPDTSRRFTIEESASAMPTLGLRWRVKNYLRFTAFMLVCGKSKAVESTISAAKYRVTMSTQKDT